MLDKSFKDDEEVLLLDKDKDDVKFKVTFGKNEYSYKQKPIDTFMILKETISEQVMLKTKERYGCINLKLIHLGKKNDDNNVNNIWFLKQYEHRVHLLSIKSPAITKKSADTITKASPPMTNKSLVCLTNIYDTSKN